MAAIIEFTHPDVNIQHVPAATAAEQPIVRLTVLDRECGVAYRLNLSPEHAKQMAQQLMGGTVLQLATAADLPKAPPNGRPGA